HGTTIHGAQIADPRFERQPVTHYHPVTARGEATLAGLRTGANSRLALIGLGTGSTACLMRPSDHLTIFEIDPAVVRLAARPGGDFTFVPACQPNARIELGEARQEIFEVGDGEIEVIGVDGVASDSSPAYLRRGDLIALCICD